MGRRPGPYGLLLRVLLLVWLIALLITGAVALPTLAERGAAEDGRYDEARVPRPGAHALLPLLVVFVVGLVLFLLLGLLWLFSGRHHGPWY